MSQGRPITEEHFEQFLANLREMPNVTRAARLTGHSPKSFRDWYNKDKEFAAKWDAALDEGIENAEAEIHRRAIAGTDKPLTHKGQFTYLYDLDAIDPATEEKYEHPPLKRDANGQPMVATTKEYSDALAMFLLKAHRPEKYREKTSMELSGPNGGPVAFDEQSAAARLAAILAAARQRRDAGEEDASDLA